MHKHLAEFVYGTDSNQAAVDCAHENLGRLGMGDRTELWNCHLFPPHTVDLIVCNPPWMPGRPSSVLEQAVYDDDENESFLDNFLQNARSHLVQPSGQVWLILSNLAELLGVRHREALLQKTDDGGLYVHSTASVPAKTRSKPTDYPGVGRVRQNEVITLYKLCCK